MLIPLPYAADRPLRRFPIVTLFLVGLNCSIFLLSLTGGAGTLDYIVTNYGLRGVDPAVSTLFISQVLHAGALHLLVNVIYLWLFGCLVEDVLGRLEYLLFYLGAGVAGGMLHILIAPHLPPLLAAQPAVGASGAVAGILGIFAIRFYRAKIKMLLVVPLQIPALPAIGVWLGIQMAFAVSSLTAGTGLGCWAHIGGFAFGVLSGLLMRLGREAETEYLFEDARRDLSANNLKRAAGALGELLANSPRDPQVHLELARAFFQAKQQEAAAVHARQAVELALQAGNLDAALAHYTALLPLGILSELALDAEYRVACALESQHRLHESAQAYKHVFQHFPEAPEAEIALIRCAQVLQRLPERAAEAAGLYQEYLARYPKGQWRALAKEHI